MGGAVLEAVVAVAELHRLEKGGWRTLMMLSTKKRRMHLMVRGKIPMTVVMKRLPMTSLYSPLPCQCLVVLFHPATNLPRMLMSTCGGCSGSGCISRKQ